MKYRIGGKIVDFSINLSAFDNEYNKNSYWLSTICTKKATNNGICYPSGQALSTVTVKRILMLH